MDLTQKMLREIHSLPNSTETLLLSTPCSSCSGRTGLLARPPACQADVHLRAPADPSHCAEGHSSQPPCCMGCTFQILTKIATSVRPKPSTHYQIPCAQHSCPFTKLNCSPQYSSLTHAHTHTHARPQGQNYWYSPLFPQNADQHLAYGRSTTDTCCLAHNNHASLCLGGPPSIFTQLKLKGSK